MLSDSFSFTCVLLEPPVGLLEPPEGFLWPAGASFGLLEPPAVSWMEPPGKKSQEHPGGSSRLQEAPGGSRSPRGWSPALWSEAFWNLVEPPSLERNPPAARIDMFGGCS